MYNIIRLMICQEEFLPTLIYVQSQKLCCARMARSINIRPTDC